MFATLFAESWAFWGWTCFIVAAVMGWGLIQAAKSPLGQLAGKGTLWWASGGKL